MSIEEVLAGTRRTWVEQGEAPVCLAALPDDSVDLLFCSPPYQQARLYLEGGVDLNIARDADEWVSWMLAVCREARRVCRGLCAFVVEGQTKDYRYSATPFLLLADLYREGFNLRKPAVYARDGVPGSGGPDWLKNRWEPIVCFTRPGRLPWSDSTACGHPPEYGRGGVVSNRGKNGKRFNLQTRREADGQRQTPTAADIGRPLPDWSNPGNIIDCGADTHFGLGNENEAPFHEYLAEFFVLSFCPPGGVVLDPFSGSGTTVAMALRHGRRGIGFDLRPSQVELSRRRIATETPSLFGATS